MMHGSFWARSIICSTISRTRLAANIDSKVDD
jgi:hypothetical protein